MTISKTLFKRMKVMEEEEKAQVLVFKESKTGHYAFTLNPELDTPTQLANIQYNEKYRCIGFETLIPTVNRIFYEYGIPYSLITNKVKLSVQRAEGKNGMIYFIIRKPYEKYNWKI